MPYNNNIKGYMNEQELQILENLAANVPFGGLIVEVGSFMGRSTYCLASSAPNARIYCIDDFFDHEWVCNDFIPQDKSDILKTPNFGQLYNVASEFMNNTKDFTNITMIKGHCPNIDYPGDEIDLLFVDATHKNPNDWDILTYLLPYVKEGGMVCGHDYGHSYPDVILNVARLENIVNKPKTLYFKTTLWSLPIDKKITQEQMLGASNEL